MPDYDYAGSESGNDPTELEDEMGEALESMTAIFVRVEDGEVVFYRVSKEPMAKVSNVDGLHSFLEPLHSHPFFLASHLVFDRSFDRAALTGKDKDVIEICRVLQLMSIGGDNFETRM